MMEKIVEKMDSYNIFTNVIPGYLLLLFNIYYFKLDNFNVIEQVVVAYFIGQTLNRLGSIIVGKALLKFTKEKGVAYEKYIFACDNDKKIELLLQERNTYRTVCTLFIVCIIELICSKILVNINISNNIIIMILLVGGLIIYSVSYCKYNKYIVDRVQISNEKEQNKKTRHPSIKVNLAKK